MAIFKTSIEKRIARKFKEIEIKIKNSFALIRQDVTDMQKSIEAMKKYLKKQKKQNEYARKEDNKIRAKFRRDVDKFTQKTKQLSLALLQVKELQEELVIKKDLAQIEEKIKQSFKEEVDEVKGRIKELEKQKDEKGKKQGWFSRLIKKNLDTEEE